MNDTQTPERIWAFKSNTSEQMLCASESRLRSPFARQYVRVDLHAAVVAERDEADRRAGAAERELGWLKDESRARNQWLSDAKKKAGYEDYISFDQVFEDLLAAKAKLTELEKHRA
jgi:hypothetical protein